jgi:hypothetical protein
VTAIAEHVDERGAVTYAVRDGVRVEWPRCPRCELPVEAPTFRPPNKESVWLILASPDAPFCGCDEQALLDLEGSWLWN